jgi:hypothetical protein
MNFQTTKTKGMQRILFIIALEFLSALAYNGFLDDGNPSCQVHLKVSQSATHKNSKAAKASYPLFFGSSFMILDEKLLDAE